MKRIIQELSTFLADYRKEIRRSAWELLNQEMPALTEDLFALFEQNGNRLHYENVYFSRRKFLAVLGMEAILERAEMGSVSADILEKLCCTIDEICREECWALPAHVNRKENDSWRIAVDLFAAETAQTLSELWDRLAEELPIQIREKIVAEIDRRVLQSFFTSEVPYDFWERSEDNWNAVCSGCIGSACIHLMEPGEELEKRLERICEALPYYLKGFSEDGVCREGFVYYVYGMSYFSNFAQELYDYSYGEKDLFSDDWAGYAAGVKDKLLQIAQFPVKCFFSDGLAVSFCDANIHETCRLGIISTLAMHLEPVDFPALESAAGLHDDRCYRFAPIKMDILNTRRYLEILERQKAVEISENEENKSAKGCFYVLPDAQWCTAASANGIGFACKGGHNGEPHNHNDVGHFIYEKDGVMLLTDLGVGEYTREYFGNERYNIFCNSSFGHSVPVINGMGQRAGEEYRCRMFEASADGYVKMEIGGAYETASEIIRELQFDLENGELLLVDTFKDFAPDAEILESFVTQIRPVISSEGILLEQKNTRGVLIKGKMILLDVDSMEDIRIQEYEHRNHRGVTEMVYVIRWRVQLSGQHAVSRMRIKIL